MLANYFLHPLASLIMIAFAVRLCGIWFAFWHSDEHQLVLGAWNLVKGNPTTSIYGPVAQLFNVPAVLLAKVISNFLESFSPLEPERIAWFSRLLVSRVWLSIIPSVLTIPLVYWIAYQVYPEEHRERRVAAFWSALFLCFAFTHVEQAHYAVPDSLNTFLITIVLALSMVKPLTRKRMWLIGIVGAFAVGCKVNSLFVIFPPILAICLGARSFRVAVGKTIRLSMIFGIASLVIYAGYLSSKSFHRNLWLHSSYFAANSPLFYFWSHDPFGQPAMGIGYPILFIALIGLFRQLRHNLRHHAPLLCFLVVFAAYLSISPIKNIRWATPLIPLWCVYAGIGLVEITKLLKPKDRSAFRLLAGVLGTLLAFPGARESILFDLGALKATESYLAINREIDELVPPNTTLFKIVFGRFKLRRYEQTLMDYYVPNSKYEKGFLFFRRSKLKEWENFRRQLSKIRDGSLLSFYFRDLLGIAPPYNPKPDLLPPDPRASFRELVTDSEYLLLTDDALERSVIFFFEETEEEVTHELDSHWILEAEWSLKGAAWGKSFLGKRRRVRLYRAKPFSSRGRAASGSSEDLK